MRIDGTCPRVYKLKAEGEGEFHDMVNVKTMTQMLASMGSMCKRTISLRTAALGPQDQTEPCPRSARRHSQRTKDDLRHALQQLKAMQELRTGRSRNPRQAA